MEQFNYRIGYVTIGEWSDNTHRVCEAPIHYIERRRKRPAAVVIAMAVIDLNGEIDREHSLIWGACESCFRSMDADISGDWKLNGPSRVP